MSSKNHQFYAVSPASPSSGRDSNARHNGEWPKQPRCVNCRNAFGSFFVECKDESFNVVDDEDEDLKSKIDLNGVSSAIRVLDHTTRVPMTLKCKHRICQYCVRGVGSKGPLSLFQCPECQTLSTPYTNSNVDFELFGKLMVENEACTFDLVKELITWPHFNLENERLVTKDFEKFIMRCSLCPCVQQAAKANGTSPRAEPEAAAVRSPGDSFARIFCHDCNNAYCRKCHPDIDGNLEHKVTPVGLYFSIPNRCLTHRKNVCQYYCVQCRLHLCEACIMQDTSRIHSTHKILCLMNSTFETQFSKGLDATFKKILADSYQILRVIERELNFVASTVIFVDENLVAAKQRVKGLLRKMNQVIQSIHICETIIKIFSKYYNSRDFQMFDYGKKLLQLTRSYAAYAQSVIKLDGIPLFSAQSKPSAKMARTPNVQQNEFSSVIQMVLGNLRSFISASQCLSPHKALLKLGDWPQVQLSEPQASPVPDVSSFVECKNLLLLKPDDFKPSSGRREQPEANSATTGTSSETAASDEIIDEGSNFLGLYGKRALQSLYGKAEPDSKPSAVEHEYFFTKMDTSMQVDAYQYQYVKMKHKSLVLNESQSHYMSEAAAAAYYDPRRKSLIDELRSIEASMSCLSTATSSAFDSDDEGRAKALPVGATLRVKSVTKWSPSFCSFLRVNDVDVFKELMPRISLWCSENQDLISLAEQDILDIKPGDVYAIYRNDIGMWTRVRVRAVRLTEAKVDESMVEVLYMDIGDLLEVPANNLVKLDKGLANEKQMLIICYLYNIRPCFPPDAEEENAAAVELDHGQIDEYELRRLKWPLQASALIHDWLEGRPEVVLTVLENKYEDFYGVEITFNLGEAIRLEPVQRSSMFLYDLEESSLSESCVKCKIAHYINEQDELAYIHLNRKMPKYMPMQTLYQGEKCMAELSHLDSINEFYLRKLYYENDNGASFAELTRRMQAIYSANSTSFNLRVLNPVVRMPVAAVFTADEAWYRGEIVEVNPGELTCQVLFVDFGNIATIPLGDLRYLTKEIIIDDVRTFNCRLFGVSFKTEENLNQAFYYVYETLAQLKGQSLPIQVHIKKIVCTDSSLTNKQDVHEIIMRYPIEGKLTNVNVILNKLGYAETEDLSIFDGEKETPRIEDENTIKIIKKQPKPTPLEKVAKAVCNISVKKIKSKPANSVYCKVKNAISPSEIWVQDIVDAEGCYDQFNAYLCRTYEELYPELSKTIRDDWNVGDLAVMKKQKSMSFFRCKVHRHLQAGSYEVICLDTGEYAKVAKENLFELIETLVDKPEFKAKKCFLVGVTPIATTDGDWSSMAKAFTSETLEDSLVYVVFASPKRADDSYEAVIYVDTKQAKNVNNLILPDESKESEYIKFSDILNLMGYAMLLEKKHALDMLLQSQGSLKSSALLTIHGSYHKYEDPVTLRMDMFSSEQLTDALVTYVDPDTGDAYVQLLNLFYTRSNLRRMAYDFTNAYQSGETTLRFKFEDLRRHLNHSEAQAYVCKIKNRYYRCELDRQATAENRLLEEHLKVRVNLIDYGFSADVETENIYRPLIAYLPFYPLAFKLKINLNPSVQYRPDYAKVIYSLLNNRLAKIKVQSIEDKRVICGDVFSFEARKWLSHHLMLDGNAADSGSLEELAEDEASFKKFELPPDLMNTRVQVAVTWIDSINSIWLEVKSTKSDDTGLSLDAIHEEMMSAYHSSSLRNLKIEEIRVNTPCCSVYKSDSKVYRAKILKVNYLEELAVVRYVDFGNEEEISFNEIFELKKDYVNLCEQSVQCKLKNIAINTPGTELTPNELKSLINEIHAELDQALNNYNEEEKSLCGKICKDVDDEIYEVELLFEDRNNNEAQPSLAYESLIEKGLLRYKDHPVC